MMRGIVRCISGWRGVGGVDFGENDFVLYHITAGISGGFFVPGRKMFVSL